MGTVNDILEAFISLSVEERKRLISKMQAVSLLERSKDAKQNLLEGNVQRGSAADLIGAMHGD